MGIYSKNFRSSVVGYLGQAKDVIAGNSATSVLSALNKYRSYLNTRSGVIDSFLGAMCCDSSLIHDDFLNKAYVSYDLDNPCFTDVSSDMEEALITGLKQCVHNGKDEGGIEGVTITDSRGHAYSIVDVSSKRLNIEGKEVIFSFNSTPQSVSDLFIYKDDGGFHLNNLIPTIDFIHSKIYPGPDQRPATVYDTLATCYEIAKGNYPSGLDIHDIIADVFEWHDDIHSSLNDFINEHTHSAVEYNIYDAAYECLKIIILLHPVVVGKGYVNSIWSIVKDNLESSALNSFILRLANCCLAGYNVATEITTLVSEGIANKYKSITNFAKGVSSAYNRGGIYGVACYILTYVKELCESREDDGLMHFTDNKRFAPDIYLAGIISAIFGVVSVLVQFIVTVFSRILGVAIAILGTIASSIFKAITYDYDSTNSAMNTSDKVTIPIAPYGLCQGTISIEDVWNEDILSLLEQGENFVYCDIPGGFLILGPGAFTDDGAISALRYEFHPSIVDCGNAASRFIKFLWLNDMVTFEFSGSMHLIPRLANLTIGQRLYCLDRIQTFWVEGLTDSTLSNQENEHLSNADDEKLRNFICQNMSLGLFFIGLQRGITGLSGDDFYLLYEYSGSSVTEPVDYYKAKVSSGAPSGKGFGVWSPLLHTGEWGFDFDFNEVGGRTYHIYFNNSATLPQWLEISNQCVSLYENESSLGDRVDYVINHNQYFGDLTCFNNDIVPAIYTPKYDKKTFWTILITTLVVTALVTVAISVTVFKVKKAIIAKRAANQAKVAKAYDELTNDPTNKEKYQAYYKAVKKNNLWANLIGGSKFDTESYWNGATNASEGATQGDIANPFNQIPSIIDGLNTNPELSTLDSQLIDQGNVGSLERISKLIAG